MSSDWVVPWLLILVALVVFVYVVGYYDGKNAMRRWLINKSLETGSWTDAFKASDRTPDQHPLKP
jgi:hypothetical protein